MTSPFPERYWTGASVEFLSKRFAHPFDENQQDWPFEVADFSSLDSYLALYDDETLDENIRFTLADMVIQAFLDVDDLAADRRWSRFLEKLREYFSLHAFQIWYWAATSQPNSRAWKVSPWMRDILREHGVS